MTDRVLMLLNNKWAIGYDRLQWMIMRRDGRNKARGAIKWKPLKFITSRDTLLRFLAEMKIEMMDGTKAAIEAFPQYHREWYANFSGNHPHIVVDHIPGDEDPET